MTRPCVGLVVCLAVGCSSQKPASSSLLETQPNPPSGVANLGSTIDAAVVPGDAKASVALADASADAKMAGNDAAAVGGDGSAGTGDAAAAARCDPMHTWSGPQSVPLAAGTAFGRFGGVAANQLTIAWTSDSTIYVADRTSTAAPFGAGTALDPSPTVVAVDRVALAPTGMTLIAVVAGGRTFIGFNRAGVGSPWTALPTSQFSNIAAMIAESGGAFSDPVLGAAGGSFFFLLTPAGGAPLLAESTWNTQTRAWGAGIGFTNAELASTDSAHRRRPTGASADGLTLFLYDETAASERAAWRAGTTAPFASFVDLPGLSEAAPDSPCDTLYFVSAADAGGVGLYTVR